MTETLIKDYFLKGLHYEEILAFLNLKHDISISLSTLKKKLKCLGLNRKKKFTDVEDIVNFIERELKSSGRLIGYRWMHLRCIQNGLTVSQETVRFILNELDFEGVNIRRRRRLRRRKYGTRGPNFIWHMDAYDKLKPFGLCISGAIDGFSRYIVWLRVGRTSSDPKIIGGYYLDAVKQQEGCPRMLRADCGTENVVVEKLQRLLRENPHDAEDLTFGEKSFLYGTSQCNQRIEAWWSILRKHSSQFWMNLLETLKENGNFTGSYFDKSLIQFCFSQILQQELDQVVNEWNFHVISGSRNAVAPRGRPIIMYQLPEIHNTKNYICNINDNILLEVCRDNCRKFKLPCDVDVFVLCKLAMQENSYETPSDPYAGLNLYMNLRNYFKTQGLL